MGSALGESSYICRLLTIHHIPNIEVYNKTRKCTTSVAICLNDALQASRRRHISSGGLSSADYPSKDTIHSHLLHGFDNLRLHFDAFATRNAQDFYDNIAALWESVITGFPIVNQVSRSGFETTELKPFSVTLWLVLDTIDDVININSWVVKKSPHITASVLYQWVTVHMAGLGISHNHIFEGGPGTGISVFEKTIGVIDDPRLLLFVVDSQTTPDFINQFKLVDRAWKKLENNLSE